MLSFLIFGMAFIASMIAVFIEKDEPKLLVRKFNQWDHIKEIEDEVEDDGD